MPLTGYLGDSAEEQEEWNLYDACVIVGTVPPGRFDEILIDCGTADSFLKAGQLLPEVNPINFVVSLNYVVVLEFCMVTHLLIGLAC